MAHRRVGAWRRPGRFVEVRGVGQRQQRVQRRPLDGLSQPIDCPGDAIAIPGGAHLLQLAPRLGQDARQLDRFGDVHRHGRPAQRFLQLDDRRDLVARLGLRRRPPGHLTHQQHQTDDVVERDAALGLPHRGEPAAVGGGEIQRVGGAVHDDAARSARGRGKVGDDGGVEAAERPGRQQRQQLVDDPFADAGTEGVLPQRHGHQRRQRRHGGAGGQNAGGEQAIDERRGALQTGERPGAFVAAADRLNQRRLAHGRRRQRRRQHAAPFEREQQRRKLHQPVRRHQHARQVAGGRRGERAGNDHQLPEARRARRRLVVADPLDEPGGVEHACPLDVAQHPHRIGRDAALEGPFPESVLLRPGQPVAADGRVGGQAAQQHPRVVGLSGQRRGRRPAGSWRATPPHTVRGSGRAADRARQSRRRWRSCAGRRAAPGRDRRTSPAARHRR